MNRKVFDFGMIGGMADQRAYDDVKLKHYWLYVLKLEDEKYYVGQTSRKDPDERIKEHFNGFYSAQWVKLHKPLDVVEKIDVGNVTEKKIAQLELQRTLQYMKKYGLQSTRGGELNYSGKYVRLGSRYWREEDWKTARGVLIMTLIFLFLIIASLNKEFWLGS